MSKVIAIANQKERRNKTTTAVNLWRLPKRELGCKVLVQDSRSLSVMPLAA